ncbi:MAG: hypothetical protein AAB451_04145 [Patescibacteria group bacterium]
MRQALVQLGLRPEDAVKKIFAPSGEEIKKILGREPKEGEVELLSATIEHLQFMEALSTYYLDRCTNIPDHSLAHKKRPRVCLKAALGLIYFLKNTTFPRPDLGKVI